MTKNLRTVWSLLSLGAICSLMFAVSSVKAMHYWGNYHWGRMANPLPLELGDNVSSAWDVHLLQARDDWNASSVLNTAVVRGKTKARNCQATLGRAEVCSSTYGNTGWLGIAQIWISGDHITQGVVKLNDSYFNTGTYNTPAWRNLVTCQEVGHIFGLGHQDENFSNANLGSCMDYASDPTTNQHPNQHDFDLLEAIYGHLDSVDTYIVSDGGGSDGGSGGGKGNGKGRGKPQDTDWNNPSEWGRQISEHTFVRKLGNGNSVVTDVFWVEDRRSGHNH